MRRLHGVLVLVVLVVLTGCSPGRHAFQPTKKYSPAALKADYTLFRNILEESHPSLYWYTSKDSMNYYFDQGYARLTDSMTEPDFRTLLSYVISKINCGHTTTRYSKQFTKYLDTVRGSRSFPLTFKLWKDTMVVTSNLNRRDSLLKRGTIISSINGIPQQKLTDTLFQYLATDGYNEVSKYQQLSNRGNFGGWYRNVFGLPDKFSIGYLDNNGVESQITVPLYNPATDTGRSGPPGTFRRLTKKEQRRASILAVRNVQVDTSLQTAYMTLNSFSRGNMLKTFFKKSFKALRKNNINHLVIDVRSNGGGDAALSTLLTRYVIDEKFKIADSLYAVKRSSKYGKHIQNQWIYWTIMQFLTKKKSDNNYHFGYFERHYFKPRKKDHFNGQVYILTGGNSFSATTLFAGALKGQQNVTIIGEETGGAEYGNSAWMIPDVTLPNTKVRFRLPKFRLVVNKNSPKNGRGVQPDVLALPSVDAIKNGVDYKVQKARELIMSNLNAKTGQ
ncbi:MAG TPA: S41 family peptidase [Chitinophagaceae bacterium]